MPVVSAFRYAHLECADPPTNAKRPLPVAAENGRRRCRGEVGGNPAVPCSRGRPPGSCPRRGISAPDRAIPWPSRRSGRVAEGGALLRRYGGEFLHRGFESLLLRSRVPATLSVARRGGRAVECGGLENRYGSLGSSRVQIPPSPLYRPGTASLSGFRPGPNVGLDAAVFRSSLLLHLICPDAPASTDS